MTTLNFFALFKEKVEVSLNSKDLMISSYLNKSFFEKCFETMVKFIGKVDQKGAKGRVTNNFIPKITTMEQKSVEIISNKIISYIQTHLIRIIRASSNYKS